MNSTFRLIMISAMYENGGNTTHRFFDGHPQMFVYPFESQLGTKLVIDHLASIFPAKYRWPRFLLSSSPEEDYEAIIDEECKVRIKTPKVSKFRHMPFELSDSERRALFVKYVSGKTRSTAGNVEAFFRATFSAWKNCRRTGRERVYLGYSPVIVVDAVRIIEEYRNSHLLHIVRNPWSAYADTKKRPVPLSLRHYLTAWVMCQYHALTFQALFPEQVHILRYEDVITGSTETLGGFCEKVGLERSSTLSAPTWNGAELKEVYPWGTIRYPTPDVNLATAKELRRAEIEEIRVRAKPFLKILKYDKLI